MNAIFTRTSVRKFENRSVEKEKIEKLLQAGFVAPSAGNQQPWEFYVVTKRETIEALAKTSPYAVLAAKAPVVLVIAARKDVIFPGITDIDCAIATENLWLELEELGLGGVMMAVAPVPNAWKPSAKSSICPIISTPSPCCPSATPSARNHRSTATTPRRSTGSSKYILMKEGIVCLPPNAIYC